jgi:hypothetical protein
MLMPGPKDVLDRQLLSGFSMCVLKSNEGERKEKERKRNRGMAIDH